MIKSILDNDLYKFTQQNAVMKLYPKVKVSYKFYNRGKNKFPIDFAERLRAEVKKMELLKLTKEEKEVLKEYPLWQRPFVFIRGLFRKEGML